MCENHQFSLKMFFLVKRFMFWKDWSQLHYLADMNLFNFGCKKVAKFCRLSFMYINLTTQSSYFCNFAIQFLNVYSKCRYPLKIRFLSKIKILLQSNFSPILFYYMIIITTYNANNVEIWALLCRFLAMLSWIPLFFFLSKNVVVIFI